MSVDDIEGCKPRKEKQVAQRDTYNINDIDGAKPKKSLVRKSVHDQTYQDVTAKKVLNRDPLCNPSDPIYKIRDDKGEVVEYGDIQGSKPKVPYYKTNTEFCDMALKSRDIHGNAPGTRSKGNFHSRERRN
jgi:hypothetical protein